MRDTGLSTHPIPPAERLIFALDVPDAAGARALVATLGDTVQFYKLGLELLSSGDYFELVDWLTASGKKVFLDLKLYDIPATVAGAVRGLAARGATFVTVHGDRAIMEAAAGAKGDLRILAVTVLTSLDAAGLRDLGFEGELEALVRKRARQAAETGCDGVIASGLEAAGIRTDTEGRLLIVTPGIRPLGNRAVQDQKRVVDVAQAFRNGADYIVVGRPIRTAPDPAAAAADVQGTIAEVFAA